MAFWGYFIVWLMLLTASLIPSSSRRKWKSSPDSWSALQSSWAVVRYTNSLNTSTSSPIEWMKGLTSLRYETSCLSAGLHQLDPGQLSVSMSARWHYLFLQISYANYRSWTRLLVGLGFAKVMGSPHGCGLLLSRGTILFAWNTIDCVLLKTRPFLHHWCQQQGGG